MLPLQRRPATLETRRSTVVRTCQVVSRVSGNQINYTYEWQFFADCEVYQKFFDDFKVLKLLLNSVYHKTTQYFLCCDGIMQFLFITLE